MKNITGTRGAGSITAAQFLKRFVKKVRTSPGPVIPTFGSGMIVMAILTWCILGEGISTKTLLSLVLATTLVFIQVFWK